MLRNPKSEGNLETELNGETLRISTTDEHGL
jgi:hypothetical protein